jgi:hypothetical protein
MTAALRLSRSRDLPDRSNRSTTALDAALADSPWDVADVPKVLVRQIIGLVGLGVAWNGSSGTGKFSEQLVWTAVGAAAVSISSLGAGIWLLAGLSRMRAERQALKQDLVARAAASTRQIVHSDAVRVAAPSMRHFHRPGCQLVQGKPVKPISSSAATKLVPCGVCAAG